MERTLRLVVDRGNTRIKGALFGSDRIVWCSSYDSEHEMEDALREEGLMDKIIPLGILSDTRGGNPPRIGSIELTPLKSFSKLPIESSYESPETLGDDRIANACGALALYPDKDILIIDAGTCITFDLISDRHFLGGAISPGIAMRYRAMHEYTGKLPAIKEDYRDVTIGKNTLDSLHAGAFHGAIIEAEKRIEECRNKYTGLQVVLTGGDFIHFEKALKSPIFAHSNLTLEGLHEILLHNDA